MTSQPQSTLLLAASPIIDEVGNPTTEHFRFLQDLWKKLGGTQSAPTSAVYVSTSGGTVTANASQDNSVIGNLFVTGKAGGPAQAIPAVALPVTFAAPAGGQVITSGGTLAISRNGGGTYYGVAGGSVGVLTGDRVQVTWTGGAPTIVFLPNQ